MMPEETYRLLVGQLDELISIFEAHPDPVTQEQVAALLTAVDILHREALTRLVQGLRRSGGDALVDAQIASDPVVELLLGLYGLADLDLPEEEESADAPSRLERFASPIDAFLDRSRGRAEWIDVARAEEVPPGAMRSIGVGEVRALLVNVEGEVYAFRNGCGRTDLPLESGRLVGRELVCPWHGCRYDARSGKRLDDGEEKLDVFPVALRGESVQLAVRGYGPAR